MTEEEYHQWELEQQEQEEQGQMLNDSLYDEEKERRRALHHRRRFDGQVVGGRNMGEATPDGSF